MLVAGASRLPNLPQLPGLCLFSGVPFSFFNKPSVSLFMWIWFNSGGSPLTLYLWLWDRVVAFFLIWGHRIRQFMPYFSACDSFCIAFQEMWRLLVFPQLCCRNSIFPPASPWMSVSHRKLDRQQLQERASESGLPCVSLFGWAQGNLKTWHKAID